MVHTHYVHKITQGYEIKIAHFQGSAALNIQPVLMRTLVAGEDWVAVIRDKVMRYYHLVRPTEPKNFLPPATLDWGVPLSEVKPAKQKSKIWYQLIAIGLTQWSYARCLEHIPSLLRSLAALDGRTEVKALDYTLLWKLMKPMQLERYILRSYGFEEGRDFENNLYCILVELVSHGNPTINTICEDYKVSPTTVQRLIQQVPQWCWTKTNSPTRIMPTEQTEKIMELIGANQKW